jgi:hypothetical protein
MSDDLRHLEPQHQNTSCAAPLHPTPLKGWWWRRSVVQGLLHLLHLAPLVVAQWRKPENRAGFGMNNCAHALPCRASFSLHGFGSKFHALACNPKSAWVGCEATAIGVYWDRAAPAPETRLSARHDRRSPLSVAGRARWGVDVSRGSRMALYNCRQYIHYVDS